MPQASPLQHALSFDIEDWFHMVEIDAVRDPRTWDSLPSLVERYTDLILDMLAPRNVKATFFMLGWVASKKPGLVARIAAAGHELASHSFWHRRVDTLTPEEFALDLRQSVDAIEQASGRKVIGFRAPSFSIVPGSEWAFDVIVQAGLRYDASLFPARRGHGGYPCPQVGHILKTPSGLALPELPMSVMRVAGVPLPFSGGGYLRLLPWPVIQAGFSQFQRRGTPVVVYLHPRDFAANCPRVPMPLRRRFKCYVGLHTTEKKLRQMLQMYRFTNCASLLGLTQPT